MYAFYFNILKTILKYSLQFNLSNSIGHKKNPRFSAHAATNFSSAPKKFT